MTIKTITPPTTEPVTLQEVKDHLRIVHDDEDDLIESYKIAARKHIEFTLTWRALITQELQLSLDSFPPRATYYSPYFIKAKNDEIVLPYPPVQEIVSITYKDKDGTETTIPADDYIVDTDSEPARIVPAPGESWPTEDLYPLGAVKIKFKAGYGDTKEDVPNELRQAILMLTAHFYENREQVVIGATVADLPMAIDALTMPYRAWGGA